MHTSAIGPANGTTALHAAIDRIAPEWDDLVARCEASPFVRPGWLQAWLDAFEDRPLVIYTVRRDGLLVGLVPLLRGRVPGTLASPTNDHTPVWAPLAQDAQAAAALAHAVLADRPLRLRLGILERDTLATRSFVGTLERSGYRPVVIHRELSPYIDTSVGPVVFAKRFSAKTRSAMRRRARRLADLGEVTFEVTRDDHGLEAVLDEGFAVEASGWKGRRGTAITCDPSTRQFYTRVARWAGEHGWLLLTSLRVDRRMVAFSFAIDHRDVVYGLKLGYDETHAKLSPGLQVMERTFDLALSGSTRMFDLLGDDDGYKGVIADGTSERLTADWYAPTVPGKVTRTLSSASMHAEHRVHGLVGSHLPETTMERLRTLKARTRVATATRRLRRSGAYGH